MDNNAEIVIPQGTLTNADIDVVSGMMVIFMHAAEKCLQIVENNYFAEYQAGAEYKRLSKQYGKAIVDKVAKQQVKRIVRGDERNKLGKLLRTAELFHQQMESLTETAYKSHDRSMTDGGAMSAIVHDVNYLCLLYALMGNCDGKDDEIKIISTVKAFAKGKRVSEQVLAKFEYLNQ